MSNTSQNAQEERPANLAALRQLLKEMFASTKSANGPQARRFLGCKNYSASLVLVALSDREILGTNRTGPSHVEKCPT